MIKNKYKMIGVMSGTSMDGLDLAYVQFILKDKWFFKIIASETIPYSDSWRKVLKNLVFKSPVALEQIDQEYSIHISDLINQFIENNNISDLDAICSHGHTALHQPKEGLTYQIGNQQSLSTQTNHTVICDFRIQDVQLGGQGAPLVPIGDELLFSQYDFCINLGGFANISRTMMGNRIAFDICPVNCVLNYYVSSLGLHYDMDGQMAASGKLNKPLLYKLNNLNFYNKEFPKSLGIEWVNSDVIPLIDSCDLEVSDILRTYVEHCAVQITKEISRVEHASVLMTGGGVYNIFLMKRIEELTHHNIVIPSDDIIDYKEALVFGLLGVLKLRGENNCLKSVTGANVDHSSGIIYKP